MFKKSLSILSMMAVLILVLTSLTPVYGDEISDRQAKITELSQKVTDANNRVQELNRQISATEAQIETTQQDLELAEVKRDKQASDLKERLRAIYMYGNEGYVEIFFSSENLTDLLTYYDLSKSVMSADKTAEQELSDTLQEIKDKKQQLEDDKAAIEAAKAESEAVQSSLSEELAANKDIVEEMEKQASEQEAALIAAQNVQTATQDQSSDQASDSSSTASSGSSLLPTQTAPVVSVDTPDEVVSTDSGSGWVWPIDAGASNAFLITSLMGTRESPGGVGSSDHGGTDIGAAYGSTIVAAQSGTVVFAGVNGGYGNCVMIDTVDGYRIVYGHLASIGVSSGSWVSAGQSVGLVGSTGWSTGAHLHFEVRSGDSKINGLQFYGNDILSRLSYALDA